jgi:hypothetical protein
VATRVNRVMTKPRQRYHFPLPAHVGFTPTETKLLRRREMTQHTNRVGSIMFARGLFYLVRGNNGETAQRATTGLMHCNMIDAIR